MFAFSLSSLKHYPYPMLKLAGLDKDAEYKLTAFEGSTASGTPTLASGAYWMHRGFAPLLYGSDQAAGFTLEKMAAR